MKEDIETNDHWDTDGHVLSLYDPPVQKMPRCLDEGSMIRANSVHNTGCYRTNLQVRSGTKSSAYS